MIDRISLKKLSREPSGIINIEKDEKNSNEHIMDTLLSQGRNG